MPFGSKDIYYYYDYEIGWVALGRHHVILPNISLSMHSVDQWQVTAGIVGLLICLSSKYWLLLCNRTKDQNQQPANLQSIGTYGLYHNMEYAVIVRVRTI